MEWGRVAVAGSAAGIDELFTKRLRTEPPYSCVFSLPEHGGDTYHHSGLSMETQARVLQQNIDFMAFAVNGGRVGWWIGLIMASADCQWWPG